MDYSHLTGQAKAAILIRSLGKEASERILNSLTDNERQVVYREIDQMGTVSTDITEYVAKEILGMGDEEFAELIGAGVLS